LGKIVLTLFALVSLPTVAQITSGTVIVLNFTKDRLVVAADSRGSHPTGETPDDLECKLTQFRHTLLFTTSGAVGYRSPSPSVAGSNNVTAAQEAIQVAIKQDHGKVNLATVSDVWAKAIVQKWQVRFGASRDEVIHAAVVGNGVLTVGFFAQAAGGTIEWMIELIRLDAPYTQPVFSSTARDLAFCWPCGQPSGKRLCVGGMVDIAKQVCSELDSRRSAGKSSPKAEQGWTSDEALPVSVAETIAARDLSGEIHGPIDAIELTKAGKLRWLRKKGNCPDNLN